MSRAPRIASTPELLEWYGLYGITGAWGAGNAWAMPAIRRAFGGEGGGDKPRQKVIFEKVKGLALAAKFDVALALLGFKE